MGEEAVKAHTAEHGNGVMRGVICGARRYTTAVRTIYDLAGELPLNVNGGRRMLVRTTASSVAALAAGLLVLFTPPAEALTMKECSAKYQAAKTSGTLGGQSWNDFRKTQCGANAAAAPVATTPAATPAAAPAASRAPGNAVFPTAVSPKYTNQSAGKARMHTCLDQYNANKAANANGGLKWIQKGGGYYSECNKQLKG